MNRLPIGPKIEAYHRLPPDIATSWGNYASPYIAQDPAEMKYQQPGLPLLVRGPNTVRRAPRSLQPAANYIYESPGSSIGGIGETLSGWLSNPVVLLLLLGGVGLLAYWLGSMNRGGSRSSSSGVRRNPGGTAKRRKLRRHASKRKRDRKGRFV